MQDGFKVYMDSYMASNGSCVHGPLDYFQKLPFRGRPNTKTERPWHFERSQPLIIRPSSYVYKLHQICYILFNDAI
jgi:hypothetical protein